MTYCNLNRGKRIKRNTRNKRDNCGCVSGFGAGIGLIVTVLISAGITDAFKMEGFSMGIAFAVLLVVVGGCVSWLFERIGL